MNNEYKELLKDGRWQRKRLEIMQRDGFICRECGTTSDLNVHHTRYIKGRKPWEYDDDDLVTLCGSCHKRTHDNIKDKERAIEEYIERMNRLESMKNLLLYYEDIEGFGGVITSYHVWNIFGEKYYNVDFYYSNVHPIMFFEGERWQLSPYPGQGGNLCFNLDDCKKIMEHIFYHSPDEVFSKREVEILHEICELDENQLMPDDFTIREDILRMNRIIMGMEERYDRLSRYERWSLGLQ